MNRTTRSRATYILLGIIIVVLSLYVALRQRDRLQYTIPGIEPFSARDIEKLELEQTGGIITIERSGHAWQILPEAYRADPTAIGEMLKAITGLQLSDLASVTGDYNRYDLDEQSRIRVTAYKNNSVLRRFDLGKRSPAFNQTFIRIDGDDRVFQTPGNLGAVFGVSKEALRDRLVLSIDPETITEIRSRGPGWTVNLIRTPGNSRQGQNSTGGTDRDIWRAESGDVWEADIIDELLNTLSDLNAFRFREQGSSDGESVITIVLKGKKLYTLEVFARQENLYPARSSESEYPFALFYAVTENITDIFAGNR